MVERMSGDSPFCPACLVLGFFGKKLSGVSGQICLARRSPLRLVAASYAVVHLSKSAVSPGFWIQG